jgi:hypothetical protein
MLSICWRSAVSMGKEMSSTIWTASSSARTYPLQQQMARQYGRAAVDKGKQPSHLWGLGPT